MHSEFPECILSWLHIGFWKLNGLLLVYCENECVWNKLQSVENLTDISQTERADTSQTHCIKGTAKCHFYCSGFMWIMWKVN